MKIKFPKTIKIGDTIFKVKVDPKKVGGSFCYWNKKKKEGGELIIGTELLKISPIRVLATIIHELKEIIQVEQGVRFEDPTADDNFQFHYHHKEHTDLCARLAGALIEFLK